MIYCIHLDEEERDTLELLLNITLYNAKREGWRKNDNGKNLESILKKLKGR